MLSNNENNSVKRYSGVMFFNSDKDFYEFCVKPIVVVRDYINPLGEQGQYLDFDFSDAYNDAIQNNIAFVIKDKNSQILKHHGVVSYRTLSKQSQNLEPWFYEKYFTEKFNDNNE